CIVFFFQAEDGIRDFHVTGVQTCALPISRSVCRHRRESLADLRDAPQELAGGRGLGGRHLLRGALCHDRATTHPAVRSKVHDPRSEERRVGKESKTAQREKEKAPDKKGSR